jgi:hypothetical protein
VIYKPRELAGHGLRWAAAPKNMYIQGPPRKCIHTLTKENSTLYNRFLEIHNIFPSTQRYDICIYFNITYIVILATCFDSYESSSGINIQELPVHIVSEFLCLSRTIAIGIPLCITKPGLSPGFVYYKTKAWSWFCNA